MSSIFGDFSEGAVRWQPNPNQRGTFDILTTCIVTISLCVWTALHLNVPAVGESSTKQMFRKIGWLCVGLLAPEVVSELVIKLMALRRIETATVLQLMAVPRLATIRYSTSLAINDEKQASSTHG